MVDEEIEVCTADMTGLQIILIIIEIFAEAKINLHFAEGKLSFREADYHSPQAIIIQKSRTLASCFFDRIIYQDLS